MRSAISLLTTLATVFHLAVGCCLHACHADGVPTCRLGGRVECHDGDCGDHGLEDDHDREHGRDRGSHAADECGTASVAAASPHGCQGCDCAATIEANSAAGRQAAAMLPVAAFEAESIATRQAARGPSGAADAPVLSALRPPLFERLLV